MPDPTPQQWQATLAALALRDGTVEISAIDPLDERVWPTHKVRVFSSDGAGALKIEMPTSPGASQELDAGVEVQVLAIHQAQRIVGRCPVVGAAWFELGGGGQTRALRLGAPTELGSAQRRRFFRVATGAVSLGRVSLYPRVASPPPGGGKAKCTRGELPGELPGGRPLKAHLLNISGGGLGLSADRSPALAQVLRSTTRFMVTVPLPDDPTPLSVHVRLVHLRPMAGQAVCLGMAFDYEDTARQREVEDRIQRVSTQLQRDQIRRQRGA